jgi:cell volume regulation protein A
MVALILILFDGGLNTPFALLVRGLAPAALWATVGIAETAALIALCTRLFNFSWALSILLGSHRCANGCRGGLSRFCAVADFS